MNKKLLLYRGLENEEVDRVTERIMEWASTNGIFLKEISDQPDIDRQSSEPDEERILLSLGGDGTFLQAADLIAPFRIPILGINLGELGFLTGLDSSELNQGLETILKGDYSIEKLARLKCNINPEKETLTALNEVTISRANVAGLAEVELYLDERKVATYPGDGLIVSTPTGSTAYSLSCGGPLITRNTPAFSITPLNVHKLGLRPIICSDKTSITIRTNTPVSIQVDGRDLGIMDEGKSIKITKSPTPTLMIVPEDRSNFFETVRNKLNWDKDRGTRY